MVRKYGWRGSADGEATGLRRAAASRGLERIFGRYNKMEAHGGG